MLRSLALCSLAVAAAGLTQGGGRQAGPKPNILFLMIDDLGHDDMSFLATKPQIRTPVADRFAHEGQILDGYYVQPSCSPTRTTMMSGRYPLHTGVNNYIPVGSPYGLSANETTMADVLKAGGYATHAVGKWHLGMYSYEMTPTFRGFESFYGFYNGGEDYYKHTAGENGYDMRSDVGLKCGKGCSKVEYGARGTYSTTLFTTKAVEVVKAHDPEEKPLFLYLAYQAVHAPAEAPASYVAPYLAMGLPHLRATYGGMIACLDEGIGNVTQALEDKGMLDNTLIFFSADNGGPSETCAVQGSSNWPLRGSKCSLWEGGTKASAFVWSGPKVAAGQIAPGRFPDLMHAADWLPTVSELTGVPCAGCLKWDGVSQWKQMTGQTTQAAREDIYYGITDEQVGEHGPALRKGCYKVILGSTGGKPGGWPAPPNATARGGPAELFEDESFGVRLQAVPYPPNPGHVRLLFDVCTDPNEHTPLDVNEPANKKIADELSARIADYWKTATPGCPNPQCEGWGGNSRCGTGHPVEVAGEGLTWEPWCDNE